MATTRKKASAKRTVKSAVKTQSKAAHAAAAVAKSAAHQQADYARKGAEWAQRGANEWQKGANEWAKQSAKMYQLPFAGGDAAEATKQAAATVQSATQNMMRAGTDMMSKMFGGANPLEQLQQQFQQAAQQAASSNPFAQFGQGGANPFAQFTSMFTNMPGAEAATGKLKNLGRESAEQMSKLTSGATRAANEAAELSRENAQAAVECGNLAIAVSKDIGAELITYTNKTFSQNVELSKQLLTCRTLNDMFDLSSKFMKSNLDGFFSESVKISEMLFQCATDVSEPLNERFSETSERLSKAIAA